jgi:acetylornithine aminotransferase
VPIGAVVAHRAAAAVLGPGNHGSTFGGNPLAMRAGLATIAAIESEGLLENASRQEARIRQGLERHLGDVRGVIEIRGRGLMLGVALDRPCGQIVGQALQAGLVLNVTADSVIRLLPPLIFQDEHSDLLVETLAPLVRSLLEQDPA